MQLPSEEVRETTAIERGEILVDLLLLTYALPACRREDLLAPTFRELCVPR